MPQAGKKVNVTAAAAAQLSSPTADGSPILFLNNGTVSVYLGADATVSPSFGSPCEALGTLVLPGTSSWWAIADPAAGAVAQVVNVIPGGLAATAGAAQIAAQVLTVQGNARVVANRSVTLTTAAPTATVALPTLLQGDRSIVVLVSFVSSVPATPGAISALVEVTGEVTGFIYGGQIFTVNLNEPGTGSPPLALPIYGSIDTSASLALDAGIAPWTSVTLQVVVLALPDAQLGEPITGLFSGTAVDVITTWNSTSLPHSVTTAANTAALLVPPAVEQIQHVTGCVTAENLTAAAGYISLYDGSLGLGAGIFAGCVVPAGASKEIPVDLRLSDALEVLTTCTMIVCCAASVEQSRAGLS